MNDEDQPTEEKRPPRIGKMVEVAELHHLRWLAKNPPPPRIGRMIEESLLKEQREKRE